MASSLWRAAMGSRCAAATVSLHLMLVATLASAGDTIMSMVPPQAGCSKSMAQKVSSTSGRFRVPEGAEDGLYMGTVEVDEQGVEQYRVTFLGKGNTTLDGRWANNNVSRAATGGLGRKLLQDSGTHCDGTYMDANHIIEAVAGVANHFGYAGSNMPGHTNGYYVFGCTVAYVCNYNDGDLLVTSAVVSADHFSLNQACSVYGGGWYAHETTGMGEGRTYVTNSFC